MNHPKSSLSVAVGMALAVLAAAFEAGAHCDTMEGPLIKDVQAAFASGDVTGVLKWVQPQEEATVAESFRRAAAVRGLGAEARDLAERYFIETLVRIHREGEGEPYTGVKPAGTAVDPGILAADEALAKGSVEPMATALAAQIEKGLRERFGRAAEARKHASESVEQGRAYVSAYVQFMHYAERLVALNAAHPEHAEPSAAAHRH